MPTLAHLVAFAIASVVLVLIPGPSLLFTVGRAISAGRRDALLSVLGNALGILTQIAGVAAGLGPVVAASATAYTVIKLAGAAYLVWLGIRAWRERRAVAEAFARGVPTTAPTLHALRTGWLVGVTNPKTVVFFAALLPQFVDPHRPVWSQMLVLGLVFGVIAVTSDSSIALLAGRFRDWFASNPARLARVGGAGGLMMIGLGAGVAVTGRPD